MSAELRCPHLSGTSVNFETSFKATETESPVNVLQWGSARWAAFRFGGDKMYDDLIDFLKPVDVVVDHVAAWKKVQCKIDESHTKGLSRKNIDELVYKQLFSVIGLRGLQAISKNFYERVWNDADWFRRQFVEANPIEEEIVNQWTFFVQFLGGPKAFEMWRSRLGEEAMILKHALFEMTGTLMSRWMQHMTLAAYSALEGNLYLEAPDSVEYFLRYCKSFGARLLS